MANAARNFIALLHNVLGRATKGLRKLMGGYAAPPPVYYGPPAYYGPSIGFGIYGGGRGYGRGYGYR